MPDDDTGAPFGWFLAGLLFLLLGVAVALYGAFGTSCLLGSLVFYGLSCIGGWVFLGTGFVLLALGGAMMVVFRMEV